MSAQQRGAAPQTSPAPTSPPMSERGSSTLPPLPATYPTALTRIKVSAVVTGLVNPWSLAFLPNGDMLITERAGRLRMVRNGVLDPTPISGVPAVKAAALAGLLEVSVHPKFAENKVVYLAYSKAGEKNLSTTALARGRLEGMALVDVKDIFIANTWSPSNTNFGGRIAWDKDGLLYLTVGERQEPVHAQNMNDHGGKVLRLKDDGTPAPGNPFLGKAGHLPEIYSYGHRSPQGLMIHPDTGVIYEHEHGPLGGDELNVVLPGKNYGWPLVTYGTDYDGSKLADAATRPDVEAPFVYWVPSIAPSGLMVYTGDKFPQWKGNILVGAMFMGRSRGTGHIQRITFNNGRPIQREPLLFDLHQRVRDVRQGPDGLIYVLTDEQAGALLKIEPAQ
jgi:glucose/arabinose dehydrogenase